MRLSAAAVLLAALVAAPAGGTPGEDGGLDLAAVRDAVDAGAASGGGAPYGRLQEALLRAGRGLPSDLAALRSVAKACEGSLSGDATLRGALSDALDAAGTALRGRDAEAVAGAGLLDVDSHRDRVLAAASRARARERDGEILHAEGKEVEASGEFRAVATAFERTLRAADRLLRREAPRRPLFDVPVKDRGGALLGVWGSGGPDPRIIVVGADDGKGPQLLALHPGAEGWVRIPVAASGDLRCAAGIPGDGVWACGSGGRVVRYDPVAGEVSDRSTGAAAVLHGLWGSGGSDVWAVGETTGPGPALFHWDGSSWTGAEAPAAAAGKAIHGVIGTTAQDVWACGQGGLLLRFDGTAWAAVESGTTADLHALGGGDPLVAAGGGESAVIVRRGADGTWTAVPVEDGGALARGLRGIAVPADRSPMAVGGMGTVVSRRKGRWTGVQEVPADVLDLHAVWMDEAGNAVMVGGAPSAGAGGQIVTWGKRRLPSEVVDRVRLRGATADLLYASCAHAGCHLPPFANQGLDFSTADFSRAGLVGVPSAGAPLLRVMPGRPSQSYLWHKLAGTHESVGGTGERMPDIHEPGDTYLDDADMALVRAWILDGGRDN